jgi:PAS domain S-box-containing protein
MRTTGSVYATTSAVIIVSTVLTYLAGDRVVNLHRKEQQRRQTILAMDDLLITIQNAETGQRGYILTGDDAYLEPFRRAEAELAKNEAKLSEESQLGITGADVAQLKKLISEKMAELRQTIQLKKEGETYAAQAIVRSNAGRQTMDEIRGLIGRLKENQEQAVKNEVEMSDRATRLRTIAFTASAIFYLIVLYWGYRRISHAIAERHAFALERQKQSDLLTTTLSSIGDCVIVTDVEGQITFMNGVAESVTGYTAAEARDKPVHEVFKIINEHTREAVEDPVKKVIRAGVVVGLANHTVLVRKDGSEIPIDDSGAPIRSPDGQLEGVVLVFRDFSEHKESERALRAAMQAAESANQAKDKFLAMLSHELRTPLTPVLATLNLWQTSGELPEKLRADVQMLQRNVLLEARIIDDLLDITRIERGVLSFKPEIVDVHSIIRTLVELTSSEALGKKLSLETDLRADRHFVSTDAGRLQQVLWNILRNAINFTEPGGKITIRSQNDSEQLKLTITDNGLGMSPETLDRLFMPFEQGDRARSSQFGGLGLGMAISHALVKRMGGTIEAMSEGLGRGSTFVITLDTTDQPAGAVSTPAVEPGTRKRGRILLAEDHADTLTALARLLRSKGHEVKTASSVRSALELFEHESFDLLCCDIGLPDGTGYDLIAAIPQSKKVPAIALTGFGMSVDIDRAHEAGFDAHLTKPIDFARLQATIDRLLS